jgi:hypothetical protein
LVDLRLERFDSVLVCDVHGLPVACGLTKIVSKIVPQFYDTDFKGQVLVGTITDI